MLKIRTRFAPSPTGYLHIGGLRTALFAYLIAKSLGGKIILRIEDTDAKRKVEGAAEKLIAILDWAGIKFDEHPSGSGQYGPYVQSERLAIYKTSADQLLGDNKAYRCFCSPERLEKMRAEQAKKKLAPRYDRACRDLSEDEINAMLTKKKPFVIRQKMPLSGAVKVFDELRGEISFKAEDLEDQVLMKSNGVPTYQLAVVVDDHLMEISHVVRGEEWIPSFPKNILLYQDFGWTPPKFIHLPLLLNQGGGKLSKRQGDVAVEDYQKKGYLPEALINFSALLGWHPKTDKEILTLEEIIKQFNYRDISVSPAIFDIAKLDYFNGYYIRQIDLDKLVKLARPFLLKNKIVAENLSRFSDEYLKNAVSLEQERLKRLEEIGELTEFFFTAKLNYPPKLLIWKNMEKTGLQANLKKLHDSLAKITEKDWQQKKLEKIIMALIKAEEGKVGEYLWPLRVALTGRQGSPGPFAVAEVLGKKMSLDRIKEGIIKSS